MKYTRNATAWEQGMRRYGKWRHEQARFSTSTWILRVNLGKALAAQKMEILPFFYLRWHFLESIYTQTLSIERSSWAFYAKCLSRVRHEQIKSLTNILLPLDFLRRSGAYAFTISSILLRGPASCLWHTSHSTHISSTSGSRNDSRTVFNHYLRSRTFIIGRGFPL